jgi:hypothetical protein
MQCIYAYIPVTNHVSRKYSVAAILLLLFTVHITLFAMLNLLYFYICTFRSTSVCAVPNMAVFCSSLISCFLDDFETVPVARIITGITFVFTFYMFCICIVRYLYFKTFSAFLLIIIIIITIIIKI